MKATDKGKQEFLLAYEETRNAAKACNRCGIVYSTYKLWLKKYPEFLAAFEEIRNRGMKGMDIGKRAFLLAYGETRNAQKACKRCGIAFSTYKLWLKKYPEFLAAFEEIRRPVPGSIKLDEMEIRRMASAGASGRQIAKSLGAPPSGVSQILKRLRIQDRNQVIYDMAQRFLTTKCTSSRILPASEARDIFGF